MTMVAASAIVPYEHALTLSLEARLIWTYPRLTAITLLFYLNRLLGLIMTLSVIFVLPDGDSECWCLARSPSALVIHDVALIFLGATWAAFSAVRTYAMGNGALKLSACVLLLNMIAVSITVRHLALDFANRMFPVSNGHEIEKIAGIYDDVLIAKIIAGAQPSQSNGQLIERAPRCSCPPYCYEMGPFISCAFTRSSNLPALTEVGSVCLICNMIDLIAFMLTANLNIPYLPIGAHYVIMSRFLLNIREAHGRMSSMGGCNTSFTAGFGHRNESSMSFITGMESLLDYGINRLANADGDGEGEDMELATGADADLEAQGAPLMEGYLAESGTEHVGSIWEDPV